MRIKRDRLLYEQESIDDRLEKANKIIDNTQLKKSYDDKQLNEMIIEYKLLGNEDMKLKIIKYVLMVIIKLGGKQLMNKLVLEVLEAIQKTDLDDKVYEIVADKMKEEIPGERFEPILGETLEKLGQELKKKNK